MFATTRRIKLVLTTTVLWLRDFVVSAKIMYAFLSNGERQACRGGDEYCRGQYSWKDKRERCTGARKLNAKNGPE